MVLAGCGSESSVCCRDWDNESGGCGCDKGCL